MLRKLFVSAIALGSLAGPASAQVWGGVSTGFRIGNTPVGISVGTGPAVVAPAPVYAAPPPPPVYYAAPVYAAPTPVFVGGVWRYPVWVGRPGYYHGRYYARGYWRR